MKQTIRKNNLTFIHFFFTLVVVGFLASCDSASEAHQNQSSNNKRKVIIKDKKGNQLVVFEWDEQVTHIKTPTKQWQQLFTDSSYTSQQQPLVQLKTRGLNFTAQLYNAQQSKWQIHFFDDTMRIAYTQSPSNEVYKVVQRQPDKYWVYHSDREIGKTKISNGVIDVDGYGIDLKIPAHTNSYAYTLLMMFDIPETIRYTFMVELLKRGL